MEAEVEVYELTVSFDTFGDMVKAMQKIKNMDVHRKSLVHGFTGRVRVVLCDETLAALPAYAQESYEANLQEIF
jgi:hypothetical protein